MRGWVFVALAVVVVFAAVAPLIGLSLWISCGVAAAPWFFVLSSRHGVRVATPFIVIGLLWAVLIALIAAAVVQLDLVISFAVVSAVVGLIGVWMAARTATIPTIPWRGLAVTSLPTFSGAAVWFTVLVIASGYPRAERLGWSMANDALNNLMFAREILHAGGISAGPLENPVPLPSGVIAVAMAAGRAGTPSRLLLEHDISAGAQIWGILIALTCIMAGLVASSIARKAGSRPTLVVCAAVLGSFVPLTWIFTGYPMEYGFINTHLALPILFSAILLYLHADRSLALAITGLLLAGTLMLGVWSPLILVPAGLTIALVVPRVARLVRLRGGKLALVVFGVVQLVAYGIVFALPPFLSQRSALAGSGGIYRLPEWVVFFAGSVLLVLGWLLYRRFAEHGMLGLSATVVSGWCGLAALLYISRHAASAWTYYPLKLAWFLTLIFLVLLLGVLVALVSAMARTKAIRVVGMITIGILVVGVFAWTPPATAGYNPMNPLQRVLGLNGANDHSQTYERMLALANPEKPAILWKSDLSRDAEGLVNVWLTLLWADSMTKNSDLRLLGLMTYSDKSIQGLCGLSTMMGPGLEVHTSDGALHNALVKACPSTTARVVLEAK